LGIQATIFMPIGVALPKLLATRSYGADVQLVGNVVDETLRAAADFSEQTGAVLIHPFDHADIVAGQGSLGLEILEQVPDLDTIIVPIGGGGLIAGVASAIKQRAALDGRTVRVIGVQAENAAAYPVSLERGEPTTITTLPTIADGIAVGRPGALNFAIIAGGAVDEVVTVSDDETAKALLALLERAKLVVEPAGAVGVAALMAGRITVTGRTVFLLSGGNIDAMMIERVISHGLSSAERYLKLRIPLPDRPGQLAEVSRIVADRNANVLEVLHTRHNRGLQISQVELELHIETRGPDHTREVLAALEREGFEPRIDF
jgi:threonine dehydratase